SSHKRDLVDLFVANLGDVPFTRRVKKALTNARAHGYKTTDPYELKSEDIEDVKRYVNQSLKHAMQFKAQFDQSLGITAPPEPTTKPKTWDDMPPGKPVLNSYSNP
ncbi:hypothetical protein ADUPG1_005730, partial [Aduncisulcus paluster]